MVAGPAPAPYFWELMFLILNQLITSVLLRIAGLLLLVSFFLFSCEEEKQTQIPANVIAQGKMGKILMELHDAEAKLIQSGIRQDTSMALFLRMQEEIYRKYKVDTGSVNRSLRFYTQHIEILDSVYARMVQETTEKKVD